MTNRKIDWNKILATFAMATLIFILGILLGNFVSEQKMESVDRLATQLQLNTMGTELRFEILAEKPCNFFNNSDLTLELYEIGSRLDFMESELGQDDFNVLTLKEYYHLLELRHWLFLRRSKDICEQDVDLILYFYSNRGDCSRCKDQGAVLTSLRRKYPNVNIYSFDANIKNPALETLKNLYGIEKTFPAIVINENTSVGFMNRESIENQLINI